MIRDSSTWLYPATSPYATHQIAVGDGHTLNVEEYGNPKGKPVLYVHGGPGSGFGSDDHRFFNPEKYRAILVDQRGAGKSTPHASLDHNTTWNLVADFELIRKKLGIARWMVFGGSWGSTLGLAYSETHPEVVTQLILRGIFLCREAELQWFYQKGIEFIFPDFFEPYRDHIPADERGNMISAYYKRLTSSDATVRIKAAQQWSRFELLTSNLIPNLASVDKSATDHFALSLARIEAHYFMNRCFFKEDGQLLIDAHKIKGIPTILVHGRYDVVCPVNNAWDLHKKLPDSELFIVPDAGHSRSETGISQALVAACDRFALLQ
jgi:proline iminopeptidase